MVKETEIEPVVADGALLSMVEIGLGSVLHAWSVPFAGHFLSLNQGFILCRGLRNTRSRSLPSEVSNVAAALKSLSPAGKKLTPMLALSAQGICFSIGPWILGNNPLGLTAGMLLLSLWGFFQPLALAYLLFGQSFLEGALRMVETLDRSMGVSLTAAAIAFVVAAKMVAAVAVVVAAYRLPESVVSRYVNRMIGIGKTRRPPAPRAGHPARLALQDLMSPLFLISLGLSAVFFIWADSPRSAFVWGLLRPVALGFLVFFFFRILPLENWLPTQSNLRKALVVLKDL